MSGKQMTSERAAEGLLQRKCACGRPVRAGEECEECRAKRRATLQRAALDAGTPGAVPPIVHEVLGSPGQPLDGATRAFMEPRFGHDFSGVRVHTDPKAAASARAVNALAYTVGRDVVFGAGQYRPQSSEGKRLLAHELAHTIQQSRGGLPPVIDPNVAYERQAHTAAAALVNGQANIFVEGAAGAGIMRQAKPPEPIQPLSAEELFNIIVRERAFTFNRGGQVTEDPRGEGRGIGPAAGGRAAGFSVFAVVQVTDSQGNVIVRSRGDYVQSLQKIFGTEHAEPRAMRALEPSLQAAGERVRGGTMLVVLDQEPCGPDRANCAANLRATAQRYGLGLDVRVPTRGDVRDPGREVASRTATKDAQRVDLQARTETQVRLRRLDSLYIPPPAENPPAPVPKPAPAAPAEGAQASSKAPDKAVVSGSKLTGRLKGRLRMGLRWGAATGGAVLLTFLAAYIKSKVDQEWVEKQVQKKGAEIDGQIRILAPKVATLRAQAPETPVYANITITLSRARYFTSGDVAESAPIVELESVDVSTRDIWTPEEDFIPPDLLEKIFLAKSRLTFSVEIEPVSSYIQDKSKGQ